MPKKAESLIIGISGGIDSSVSSTLSAMTGLRTIVLSMPIKQKENQHDLSLKHQKWLTQNFKNVEAHTISLDNLYETFSIDPSSFAFGNLMLYNLLANLSMYENPCQPIGLLAFCNPKLKPPIPLNKSSIFILKFFVFCFFSKIFSHKFLYKHNLHILLKVVVCM